MEHTPKNLLIRAVRRPHPADSVKPAAEYRAFIDFWHARPTLERLLEKP
jgi:hypothetical protein